MPNILNDDVKPLPSPLCPCEEDVVEAPEETSIFCECERDEHGLKRHIDTCVLYNNAEVIFASEEVELPPSYAVHDEDLESRIADIALCICGNEYAACTCKHAKYEPEISDMCLCCKYPKYKCNCDATRQEALQKWRTRKTKTDPPILLEPDHPLMSKFQETLQKYLERENEIINDEVLAAADELKEKHSRYDKELEEIYKFDHNTNQQRQSIEEYESTLKSKTKERMDLETKARELAIQCKNSRDQLHQNTVTEHEVMEELEALSALCRQFEQWQKESESDLVVSQRMSEKMKSERRELAQEKRELDIILYRLEKENFHLNSEMEVYQKQMRIKSSELEQVRDRAADGAAELEALQREGARLTSTWNSVIINIQQRDKVFNAVKADYKELQENYHTLLATIEAIRKATAEEMQHGQQITMNRERLLYDSSNTERQLEAEEAKRNDMELKMDELTKASEITESDQAAAKAEKASLGNVLKNKTRDWEKVAETKVRLEGEILSALQERLTSHKAVEVMANGIRKMRDLTRKQEVNLMTTENQHAKVMLTIEVQRVKNAELKLAAEKQQEILQGREKELAQLEDTVKGNVHRIARQQRELDIMLKKYNGLVEQFDMKSPEEQKLANLEKQIQQAKNCTEELQQGWLRVQSHVVNLTAQHQTQAADIGLIRKQVQICEQKCMRLEGEAEEAAREAAGVRRAGAELRARLQQLSQRRAEHAQRNVHTHLLNSGLTFEYSASLKDAETDIIQLEEDITELEQEKERQAAELDKIQREALVWQRKGILAVELKRNIANAKSQEGEIFQMKSEIQKMTVRQLQLRRTADKLSGDLSTCVMRRAAAADKQRAALATEQPGAAPAALSRRRLRDANADNARITKEIQASQDKIEELMKMQTRLKHEIEGTRDTNYELTRKIAKYRSEVERATIQKQWNLERIVRNQRRGRTLQTVYKKYPVRINFNKSDNSVVEDHERHQIVNESLSAIVGALCSHYPYLEGKLMYIMNTLNIKTPTSSPRLGIECHCHDISSASSFLNEGAATANCF